MPTMIASTATTTTLRTMIGTIEDTATVELAFVGRSHHRLLTFLLLHLLRLRLALLRNLNYTCVSCTIVLSVVWPANLWSSCLRLRLCSLQKLLLQTAKFCAHCEQAWGTESNDGLPREWARCATDATATWAETHQAFEMRYTFGIAARCIHSQLDSPLEPLDSFRLVLECAFRFALGLCTHEVLCDHC